MAEVTSPENPGAQEKAQEVAGQAQEKVQEAAGQAKGRLREQVAQRSTETGQQVSSTAGDLRTVGEQLREQGKDTPARLADQAAERVEQVGGYLERSDADQLLRDVEDFARRQPMVVALGGLALGFAASRFLKASSAERYQASRSTPPSSGSFNGTSSSERFPRPGTAPAPGAPVPASGTPVV